MFRNLGGLFILKVVTSALVRGQLQPAPEESELGLAIDMLHASLGANYLRASGLPDYIVKTAAQHHAVDLPFDPDHTSLHIVRLADGLCQLIGVSPFATGELGPLAEESADHFDISPERLETFELQFPGLTEQLGELT